MQFHEAQEVMKIISVMKQETDFIMDQLSEGDYASTDTFANNWLHLVRTYEQLQLHLTAPGVMDVIVNTDILLAADLIATARAISMVNNFMRCAKRQALPGAG